MVGRRKRANEVEVEGGAQAGEDRFSTLPDDLIHKIFSWIDATLVIQTCLFSSRWRHVWKSLNHIHFDRDHFSRMHEFCKFVTQFLSHRYHTDLTVLTIHCPYGSIDQFFLRRISAYAYSHNIQRLEICSNVSERKLKCGRISPIPQALFSCRSLKKLYLHGRTNYLRVSKESWNFPALTSLFMEHFCFIYCCDDHSTKSVDLFSNLPNLKKLSMIYCFFDGSQDVNIISPQLENLVITRDGPYSPKFTVSAPKLSSFEYTSDYGILMSASDLHCLDKIYINIYSDYGILMSTSDLHCLDKIYINNYGSSFLSKHPAEKKRVFWEIMDMFNQLRSVTIVTLTLYTVEVLSWGFRLLENKRSPFSNMKCLKIVGSHRRPDTLSADVITYLCNSSPNSTFINESCKDFQDL